MCPRRPRHDRHRAHPQAPLHLLPARRERTLPGLHPRVRRRRHRGERPADVQRDRVRPRRTRRHERASEDRKRARGVVRLGRRPHATDALPHVAGPLAGHPHLRDRLRRAGRGVALGAAAVSRSSRYADADRRRSRALRLHARPRGGVRRGHHATTGRERPPHPPRNRDRRRRRVSLYRVRHARATETHREGPARDRLPRGEPLQPRDHADRRRPGGDRRARAHRAEPGRGDGLPLPGRGGQRFGRPAVRVAYEPASEWREDGGIARRENGIRVVRRRRGLLCLEAERPIDAPG